MEVTELSKHMAPVRLRPKQWMQLTGMGRNETYQNIYQGNLRAVQVGKCWFIDAGELTEFFERMKNAA